MQAPLLPEIQAYLETPIGRLKFYTSFVGGQVENLKIVQRKLEPLLPIGMNVSACLVVLLQFSIQATPREFVFHCDWVNFDGLGHGNTGEGLDAWEWEDEKYLVMIGTEDADLLSLRIPFNPFSPMEYPITMNGNKIGIKLNEPLQRKTYTLHFVVAWNPIPEPRELSCWYAVDVPHKLVMKQLAGLLE